MPGAINTRVTLDSNVLISAVKGKEKYSEDCREIIANVGTSFVLYQPTVCITEVYNGIGRTKGEPAAKKALKDFYKMVYHLEDYGSRPQCERVGKTALNYRVYSALGFEVCSLNVVERGRGCGWVCLLRRASSMNLATNSYELVRTRIEDFSKLCFAFFARFAVLVDESPRRTQRARRFWGASSHFAAAPGYGNGGG